MGVKRLQLGAGLFLFSLIIFTNTAKANLCEKTTYEFLQTLKKSNPRFDDIYEKMAQSCFLNPNELKLSRSGESRIWEEMQSFLAWKYPALGEVRDLNGAHQNSLRAKLDIYQGSHYFSFLIDEGDTSLTELMEFVSIGNERRLIAIVADIVTHNKQSQAAARNYRIEQLTESFAHQLHEIDPDAFPLDESPRKVLWQRIKNYHTLPAGIPEIEKSQLTRDVFYVFAFFSAIYFISKIEITDTSH